MTAMQKALYPECKATEVWDLNPGATCCVVWQEPVCDRPGWWTGYVRFHDGLVYNGDLALDEIGGLYPLSYHERDEQGQVFGFDCNTVWAKGNQTTLEQAKRATEKMAHKLIEYAKQERQIQVPEGRLR